jgi:ATP-dependent DNA helicase RecG
MPLRSPPPVTPEIERLLSACLTPKSRIELQQALGLLDKKHFFSAYLSPCLVAGFIEYAIPDKPSSRLQKYRLTKKGKNVLANMKHRPA